MPARSSIGAGDYDECARYVAMLDDHVMRHGLVARRPVAMFYRAALACAQERPFVRRGRRAPASHRGVPQHQSPGADAVLPECPGGRPRPIAGVSAKQKRRFAPRWTSRVHRMRAGAFQSFCASRRPFWPLRARPMRQRHCSASRCRLPRKSVRCHGDCEQRTTSRSFGGPNHGQRDAREVLRPIYDQFTEGFETRDLVIAATPCLLQDPKSRDARQLTQRPRCRGDRRLILSVDLDDTTCGTACRSGSPRRGWCRAGRRRCRA